MSNLKIFAKTIENEAKAQIDLLLAQEAFKDCKVRIMPDVHAGAGCVIGFTADLGDKVIPNIVGVDIVCGMYTVCLGRIDIDYEKLDRIIRKYVPAGFEVHEDDGDETFDFTQFRCYDQLKDISRLDCSLGTLGGGNHFIEIDQDDEGGKYLVIHTGSRNLGKQVADIYQKKAIQKLCSPDPERIEKVIAALKAEGRANEISTILPALKNEHREHPPKELCYLEGSDREDYLHDMRICQRYASYNRFLIANEILFHMHWVDHDNFETIHNYIDSSNMVRKGAISAHKDEPLLIPINMRDGCILGRGKGNPNWNYSAPHGAGRLMSRARAKEVVALEDYKATMEGIYTTSVGYDTLDESPMVYKPMDEIIECIKDTVEIEKIIKPVYNFKAGN